jgi:transcriptional regulator GlxA family with amidase domain
MSLLRQGDLNVTQVALDVGYASISHFAKTFRKTYEMYPSEVRGDSQRRFGAR